MRKSVLIYGIILFTLAICACVNESKKNQPKEEINVPDIEIEARGINDLRTEEWFRNEQYCKLK